MSYVDLHCHMLPGLDDGAKTMDETLRHARRLHAEGVRDVACTPHVKRAHHHVVLSELAERPAGGHELLWPLVQDGALLQVNVCSLLGNHGLDVQEVATEFVRRGIVHCLASDGHPGTREHTLQLGFHLLLAAGASSAQAYR